MKKIPIIKTLSNYTSPKQLKLKPLSPNTLDWIASYIDFYRDLILNSPESTCHNDMDNNVLSLQKYIYRSDSKVNDLFTQWRIPKAIDKYHLRST